MPKTPRKKQTLKALIQLNFDMKTHKLLKYRLAERFLARGVSARRNVFSRVLDYKNLSINVNSIFYTILF